LVAHSRSPSASRAPPSDRMPHQARVLPSIMTAGLRDELIHCRQGEDSRITIERHRERRCNVESRNLERDFESLAPAREVPAAHAMRPPSSPSGSGGVWRLHHISGWWSGRANSGPTCGRSTTGWSTLLNFYRSTPPPSLLKEEMRPSWPRVKTVRTTGANGSPNNTACLAWSYTLSVCALSH
jgi:hypothetical protein